MTEISVLNVLTQNVQVGSITYLPGDRTIFTFDDAYIALRERPVLSLSYQDVYGDLILDSKPFQTKLPPFFANLLPEGDLRKYLAEKAGIKAERDFPLIGLLGEDLPGDVRIVPATGDHWPEVHEGSTGSKGQSGPMRFSLAGVQLKFSAVAQASGGLTIPVSGVGGDWIVKLPSTRFRNVPQNEYSMMSLAKIIGIDVPDIQLVPINTIQGLPRGVDEVEDHAFAIKRFDRPGAGRRVHIEDFAQIFSLYPSDKYGKGSYRNIAQVIWTVSGQDDVVEFVRRLVFNILIGNSDMHLKNWSVIYRDGRNPTLSPAYDFVSTIPYIEDDDMSLSLAGRDTAKYDALNLAEFKRFANKAGLPENLVVSTVLETADNFASAWASERYNLPLSSGVARVVDLHQAKLLPSLTR